MIGAGARATSRAGVVLAAALVLAGCHTPAPSRPLPREAEHYPLRAGIPGTSHVAFAMPSRAGRFFDLPWPTELRRRADGSLDLSLFPSAGHFFVGPYVAEAERDVDGFSVAPGIYFRVEGGSSAPPSNLATQRSAQAPVFLVDVDDASPAKGTFVPLDARRYDHDTHFLDRGLLAVKPQPGHILRDGTLYAAVVRRSLGDAAGGQLGTTDDLERLKSTDPLGDPEAEAARRLHARALDLVAEAGAPRADIAAIALFRTQRARSLLTRGAAVVRALDGELAPRVVSARWLASKPDSSYALLDGIYCTPSFQEDVEQAPFLRGGGGAVRASSDGAPRPVPLREGSRYRTPECGPLLRARFVMSVPRTPAPPGGFPLVISAHGTGGDAATFAHEKDFAGWAAQAGAAVVSTDQPLHGIPGDPAARPGAGADAALTLAGVRVPLGPGMGASAFFYNPLSPAAARGNMRQSVLDGVALARVFAGLDLGRPGPNGAPLLGPEGTTLPPRLSATALAGAGHSQGAQSLALTAAIDPAFRAVLLSGCGGDTRMGVLHNREVAAARAILLPLLGLEADELDLFHPMLSLVQLLADAVDPDSYAGAYSDDARPSPTSVLHLEGLRDSYNPNAAAEALAIALHATPLAPYPSGLAALSAAGFPPRASVSGNLQHGRATAAAAQLGPKHGEDGHFVLYAEPEGAALARSFFAQVFADAAPTFALP